MTITPAFKISIVIDVLVSGVLSTARGSLTRFEMLAKSKLDIG